MHKAKRIIGFNDFIQSKCKFNMRCPYFTTASAVGRSNSRNIFENLVAEEALLRGLCLNEKEYFLFLYRNDPCVVIGRNQNVLQQAALRRCQGDGIPIARRSSGGGAVYHDHGNLCFSFFTHRKDYAPAKTIQVLRLGLMELCQLEGSRLTTTERHDLFLDGRKITGSAMRVTGSIAFHHCTLLVSSDLPNLGRYLKPEGDFTNFETSSVDSVRSPVTTLQSNGAWPPPGDTDAEPEHFMATFFHLNAPLILDHSAPSLLTVDALHKVDSDAHNKGQAAFFDLDVVSASKPVINLPFLYGEGRRHQHGEALTVAEDIARMRSKDWLFDMPVFTTTVQVTSSEWLSRVRLLANTDTGNVNSALYEKVLDALLAGEVAVNIVTQVNHLKVDQIHCNLQWLENLFTAFVTGGPCDGVISGLSTSVAAAEGVLDGLRMECRPSLDLLSETESDETYDEVLLVVWRAVVELWRAKNIFDV